MADEEKPEEAEGEEGEGGGGKKKIIIIAIAVLLLLLIGGGAAAFFLLGGEEEAVEGEEGEVIEEVVEEEEEVVEELPIPAQYIALDPEFVISFQVGSRQRFLQVSIEVMTRQQTVVDAMTLHAPMVRNEIIRIISEKQFAALRTPEGRESLRSELLEEVSAIMKREAGNEGVEAVLFTNYVMQ